MPPRKRPTATNIFIFAGVQVTKLLFLGWQLMVLGFAYRFAPVKWTPGPWSFIAAFLLVDFFYYWYHRTMHEFKPLWARTYKGFALNSLSTRRISSL